MKRLWLLFSQTATLLLACWFVVATLKPEWLPRPTDKAVVIQEVAPRASDRPTASFADAAKQALPAVVHIYTSQEVAAPRNPFADDPFFRHFFGDQAQMPDWFGTDGPSGGKGGGKGAAPAKGGGGARK